MNYTEHPLFGIYRATLKYGEGGHYLLYIVADEISDALSIAIDAANEMPNDPYVDSIKWLSSTVLIQGDDSVAS